ncbi:PilN domain-containing protein [Gammaproteobacteria bacterium]|nr:PilN domain-containing protein [Gammaproteobacteria bacterium]
MIEVNLLPWRQEQAARRRKEKFFILVATGICALAFMVPVVLMTNSRVNESSQLNGYLQSRINTLDESLNEVRNLESSKAELIGQIQILEHLQFGRSDTAKVFDELVVAMPDQITLKRVERKGNLLVIIGLAESNSDVSRFMKNIDSSYLFSRPRLSEIEKQLESDGYANEFYINVHLDDMRKEAQK